MSAIISPTSPHLHPPTPIILPPGISTKQSSSTRYTTYPYRSSTHKSSKLRVTISSMEEEEKKKRKKKKKNHKHNDPSPHFLPSAEVKGIRFGVQFILKSFTVRRATPLELLSLLDISVAASCPFPSTAAYLPTSFTILAHHAWHTLTLGLGTNKSKILLFVFDSVATRSAADRVWPPMIALGDVNRKLVRGLAGCEMARFKFRKGCVTFYLYAVRRLGAGGFARADDLRRILESVVALREFLDHTAMLAMPSQRSIQFADH